MPDATTAPSKRSYEELAEIFRPAFQKIAESAALRDATRQLPFEEIDLLKELRFGALRLPVADGGYGASFTDFISLLIELSAADSNLTQILRAHFGFVEDFLGSSSPSWADKWKPYIAQGKLIGAAWTEIGDAKSNGFATSITKDGDDVLRLNGRKFYTTGALYSDWIDVGARYGEIEKAAIVIPGTSEGLTIIDDWNGFGQILTASGTTTFENVAVDADNIIYSAVRSPYRMSYYQLVHLATLAGIARAASDAAVTYLRNRKRTYTHGSAPSAKQDPLILQLLGRVHAKAHGARILTEEAARKLQRAHEVAEGGDVADIGALDIEIYLAQVGVIEQTLEATTILFNGLGASALDKDLGLDRFWRNARAISSHNPVIYKERIIGDYAVNGSPPPESWLSGVS